MNSQKSYGLEEGEGGGRWGLKGHQRQEMEGRLQLHHLGTDGHTFAFRKCVT